MHLDTHNAIDGLKQGLLFGAAVLVLMLPPTAPSIWRDAATTASLRVAPTPLDIDFGTETVSADARAVAAWAARTGDPGGLPFAILDKRGAKVYVFSPDGRLTGATPVLLGAAAGDDTVPGIGGRPIDEVQPEERTTPAGRFVSQPGLNALGEDVVWVDYGAAVSMHRVRVVDKQERRLERLATPTPDDNRISYGCINVPVAFFESVVRRCSARAGQSSTCCPRRARCARSSRSGQNRASPAGHCGRRSTTRLR
jgi:hypothetical protein